MALQATLQHIKLLLTFRHPLTGLPRSTSAVVALCCLAAVTQGPSEVIGFVGAAILCGLLGVRVVAAYALLVLSINLLSAPIVFLWGVLSLPSWALVKTPLLIWETFGFIAILSRNGLPAGSR